MNPFDCPVYSNHVHITIDNNLVIVLTFSHQSAPAEGAPPREPIVSIALSKTCFENMIGMYTSADKNPQNKTFPIN